MNIHTVKCGVLFALLGLTLLSVNAQTYILGESDRLYVRIYNVDDVGQCYINGKLIKSVGYRGDSGWLDVTGYLNRSTNTLNFKLIEKGQGWTYGFKIKKNNEIMWEDKCGKVGSRGCDHSVLGSVKFQKQFLIERVEDATSLITSSSNQSLNKDLDSGETVVVITSPNAYLFKEPAFGGNPIRKAQVGESLVHIAIKGKWFHVTHKGGDAFVYRSYAKLITRPLEGLTVKYVKITANTCYIRTEPSGNSSLITIGKKGDTYPFIKKFGDWYKIKLNNDVAYIYHTYGILTSAKFKDEVEMASREEAVTSKEVLDSLVAIAKDYKLIFALSGHAKEITCVVFSPDGKTLATGSMDKTVKVWQVSDGDLLRTLNGHKRSVTSVAFSLDGNVIASGSEDGTFKVWDANNGNLVRTITHARWGAWVRSVAFSPDGNVIASGSEDGTVKLWRVKDGKLLRTLRGPEKYELVSSMAFSPDGKIIAAVSGNVYLWRVSNGELLHTLPPRIKEYASLSCVFSPGGEIFAYSVKGEIRLYRTNDGSLIRIIEGISPVAITFLPGGIISGVDGDGNIKLWNILDGTLLTTLPGYIVGGPDVAFSSDRNMIAAGWDKTLTIWGSETDSD